MNLFRSLQARLAITLGLSITVLWLAAAGLTASRLGKDFEQVYDDGLRATADRLLPIVRHDIVKSRHSDDDGEEHDDEGHSRERPEIDGDTDIRYGENVSFVVRDRSGRVLLRSGGANEADFPVRAADGFLRTATHQIYYNTNSQSGLTIAVGEPLDQREALSRKMLLGLLSPLLVVIPFSLVVILLLVRGSLRPVRQLQKGLEERGAQDLSPLTDGGLPRELLPISAAVNQLLDRLRDAFQAERALAANAAHELRTPVAGAIAQAQRIRSETADPQTAGRASEIEATLKRLMRMSEKLMQLARAEGGRLKSDELSDIRLVVRMIADDFERAGEGRVSVSLPDAPVRSNLDPDAVGILLRNLVENALKHGARDRPVLVSLTPEGALRVANDGPPLPADAIDRLMRRFERGNARIGGTGLGLAIVKVICERTGARIDVHSPRLGQPDGVEMTIRLPAPGVA